MRDSKFDCNYYGIQTAFRYQRQNLRHYPVTTWLA